MTSDAHVPDPTGANSLQLRDVTKTYAGVAAVEGVDLDVRAGEFLTLLGPSGSGKTTTLSMIAGFTTPTSGQISLNGRDITAIPPHRRNMGMVFQNYSLFPHLSVGANVEFPLRQRGVGKAERRRRAMEALDAVELGHRADATPDQLSGGQQQRVALARALVFEPALLLMDEPFGALDRGLRERMQLEVRRIHQQLGVTILFVTHDQQEALTMSDRIAIFNQGRIEQLGTPEDLYDRPASHFVATFLGESTVLSGEAHSGTLTLDTGHHVSLGDHSVTGPARLVLRPERLRIGSAETAGSSLGGRVRDVVYLGADRRVEIETDAGLVVVRVSADVASPHSGDLVHVHWDPADAHLYPAA